MKRVLALHRGIEVQAERTNSHGGQTYMTEVLINKRFEKELNEEYIWIIKGGVTGYESMSVEHVPERLTHGWSVCVGTKGRWDTLFLPAESMQKIAEWLKETK